MNLTDIKKLNDMQFYNRNLTKLEEELNIWFQDKHTKHETWMHFKSRYDVNKIITLIDDMYRDGILRYTRIDQMYKLSVEEDIEMDVGV